jgi:hypothetical protein
MLFLLNVMSNIFFRSNFLCHKAQTIQTKQSRIKYNYLFDISPTCTKIKQTCPKMAIRIGPKIFNHSLESKNSAFQQMALQSFEV